MKKIFLLHLLLSMQVYSVWAQHPHFYTSDIDNSSTIRVPKSHEITSIYKSQRYFKEFYRAFYRMKELAGTDSLLDSLAILIENTYVSGLDDVGHRIFETQQKNSQPEVYAVGVDSIEIAYRIFGKDSLKRMFVDTTKKGTPAFIAGLTSMAGTPTTFLRIFPSPKTLSWVGMAVTIIHEYYHIYIERNKIFYKSTIEEEIAIRIYTAALLMRLLDPVLPATIKAISVACPLVSNAAANLPIDGYIDAIEQKTHTALSITDQSLVYSHLYTYSLYYQVRGTFRYCELNEYFEEIGYDSKTHDKNK